jgi:hypothetical protein
MSKAAAVEVIVLTLRDYGCGSSSLARSANEDSASHGLVRSDAASGGETPLESVRRADSPRDMTASVA